MEELKTYNVSLRPRYPKLSTGYCCISELRCDVKAPSLIDACLKAQDYFSEKLALSMIAFAAFEGYNPEEDPDIEESLD